MRTLLIANRGDVAVRIARAARSAGITPVGLFAADDADTPYLAWMAAHTPLPGFGPAAYLDVAAVVAAAHRLGADAVHPGWGFLSESPDLARACAAAGLLFVGATPALLDMLGDKRRARESAVASGLPVADAAQTIEAAAMLLQDGPILLKPASGGGAAACAPCCGQTGGQTGTQTGARTGWRRHGQRRATKPCCRVAVTSSPSG